jgi:hypothetical protein
MTHFQRLAVVAICLVTEGPARDWKGAWNIQASRSEFPIVLQNGSAVFRAHGIYLRSGNVVSVARMNSSDGNDCNYIGTISGNRIVGTYFCRNGGPFSWSAVILPE